MSSEQDPRSEPPDVLPRGATIGRYVVLGLVGRGGMGDVYAAYDPELDRKIAVKLLRARPSAGQSTSEGRTRLLREAQAIAKLSHGNVVVVYDVGTFNDVVFIAMEFIEGDTARYWLHAGDKTWQDIMRVFVAAGRGLAAAHEAGIIHRDFKPDNVMVGRDGKVRVMDFGLARQAGPADLAPASPEAAELEKLKSQSEETLSAPTVDAVPHPIPITAPIHRSAVDLESTRELPVAGVTGTQPRSTERSPSPTKAFDTNLTQTGAMLGTPAYMAPEQFASKVGDARTDQFSFCVSLYESLYGERPFEGKSFMALMASVARGVVKDAPAGTRVPVWIRKVLLRGLRPLADARYPSMAALLDALERDPSVAHRRWALGVASALMAGGLIVGAIHTLQGRRSPCEGSALKLAGVWEPGPASSPRKEAIHAAFVATRKSYAEQSFETVRKALDQYAGDWTRTHTEACEATAVHGEQSAEVLDLRMSCLQGRLESVKALTDLFARADASTVEKAASAAGRLGDLERCSDLTILRAVVKPPDDPATRDRVQLLRGRLARLKALADAGHLSEALALARPLVEETRAVAYLPLTAQALRQLSSLNTARLSETEATTDEAIWAAQASGDDEIVAEAAIFQSAIVGYSEGQPKRAQLWFNLADATLRRLGGHGLWRAWLINNQALVAEIEGRYQDALTAHKQSLELKEKILGPEHPDVATSIGNVANELAKLNRVDEALAFNGRAIGIYERSLGSDHPDTALQLANRAEFLNLAHRYDEAEPLARRALQIWERELGKDHPYVAHALTNLGRSYIGRGNARDAIPLLERAYSIRQRLDPEPSRLAETEFSLAQALWQHRPARRQALSLAFAARRSYASGADKQALASVETWLESHDAF